MRLGGDSLARSSPCCISRAVCPHGKHADHLSPPSSCSLLHTTTNSSSGSSSSEMLVFCTCRFCKKCHVVNDAGQKVYGRWVSPPTRVRHEKKTRIDERMQSPPAFPSMDVLQGGIPREDGGGLIFELCCLYF